MSTHITCPHCGESINLVVEAPLVTTASAPPLALIRPFGEWVRHQRTARGLSQGELAAQIGMRQAYLSLLEHSTSAPRKATRERFYAVLGVRWEQAA